MTEIFFNAIGRLLIVLTLSTAILLVLFRALMKEWQKSGLFVSLFLLLFFTYGHVHNFKDVAIGGVNIFRHKYLVFIWLLLGVVGITLIRRIKKPASFTRFINAMSAILLIFPVINVSVYRVQELVYGSRAEAQTSSQSELSAPQPAPDVYFIVLDAYARADVLQDLFDYDNSGFIRELQDLGFYVVECSQSNYARTQLSIASTMNMDYIPNLVPDLYADEMKYLLSPLLLDSRVRNLFEGMGYKTVAFYNGYPRAHWEDADYYLQPSEDSLLLTQLDAKLTSFEELFLRTTLLSTVIDLQMGGIQITSDPSRREADLYIMDTLPKIPQILGPKFIYAHMLLPHPPFVFGPNGEEVNIDDGGFTDSTRYQDETNRVGYRDQLIYANRRLISILVEIIENSPTPPIIIIESDHGPTAYGGLQNSVGNFMAYYFPGRDPAGLAYPTITPVNTFRLVFNTYFGGEYPLLDDISYYSDATYNFDYKIVPNTCVQN